MRAEIRIASACILLTFSMSCGSPPKPESPAPTGDTAVHEAGGDMSSPTGASGDEKPDVSDTEGASPSEGKLAVDSHPPGLEPLSDEEAEEAETKCKPLSKALSAAARKAKRRGAHAAEGILEALENPPKVAGVDVARCADLIGRDLRVFLARTREGEAIRNLKMITVGLSQAMEREPAQLCPSAPPVPSSLAQLRERPWNSDPSAWKAEGWKCLKFALVGPQSFQYELKTDADAKTYEAIARGYSVPGQKAVELYVAGKVEGGAIQPSSEIKRR